MREVIGVKLLKSIGAVLMLLIHTALTLAGLVLNVLLTFAAVLASAYMRS